MIKTTVYLPEPLKRRLADLAKREDRSEAQLIRDAVERLVEEAPSPRPTLPLFSSGDPTITKRWDELMEGFGEQ
jgi:hypothetical protein